MLGITEITVARDLGKTRGATNVAKANIEPTKIQGFDVDSATNVAVPPPAISQSGATVAAAKIKTAEKEIKPPEKKTEPLFMFIVDKF